MRRFALMLPLLALCVTGPARAATSCEVFATDYPGTAGDCRYTAAGAGIYEVESLSGFIILASSDGGVTYHTLVSHSGHSSDPLSAAVAQSGTLDTKAGDLVVVGVAVMTSDTPRLRFQDGHVKAGDA